MICPRGGSAHAPTSPVYRAVQSAGGARGPHGAEACGRSLPRVSAQARSAQSLGGRFCATGPGAVPGRRARAACRGAHCRAGAHGRPPDHRTGSGKKSWAALNRRQKRRVTEQVSQDSPVALGCQVRAVPRSSVYARQRAARRRATTAQGLRAPVERIAAQWPTCGYRRVTAQVRREGEPVNSKRVRRRMRAAGRLAGRAPKRRRRTTTNSDHPCPRYPNPVAGPVVTQPDALWVAAITSVRLRAEVACVAVLMDVYTRAIRGRQLARQLDQALTLTAVERARAAGRPGTSRPGRPSPRPRRAIRRRLRRAVGAGGEPDQHGRRARRPAAEWACRAADADDPRGGGGAHRLARLRRRLRAERALPGRGLPAQAHPFGAGLPDARRVRGGVPRSLARVRRYPLTGGLEV